MPTEDLPCVLLKKLEEKYPGWGGCMSMESSKPGRAFLNTITGSLQTKQIASEWEKWIPIRLKEHNVSFQKFIRIEICEKDIQRLIKIYEDEEQGSLLENWQFKP